MNPGFSRDGRSDRRSPTRSGLIASTLVLLALGSGACGERGAADEPWFEDWTEGHGLGFVHRSGFDGARRHMPEIMGGGGALFDMDGDGDLDAYLVQSGDVRLAPAEQPPNQLFRNEGGGRFSDVTAGSGAEAPGYGQGVAAGDYDDDGDVDLYVTNVGPDRLLRNEGGGRFRDVTEAAGIDAPGWGASATFWDYDRDGHLDIAVAQYLDWSVESESECFNNMGGLDYCSPLNYGAPARALLWHNLGDGRFEERAEAAGLVTYGTGLGVVAGDFDLDGWPDLFVANDGMANRLWINQQDGRFKDLAAHYSCAIDTEGEAKAGMGTTAEDSDDDGDLDLVVCNLVGEGDSFFENQDGQYFVDRAAERKLSGSASKTFTRFGVGMADFDNDSHLDMYQANGRVGDARARVEAKPYSLTDPFAEPNVLFRGLADAGFTEQLPRGGTAEEIVATSRAAVFGDIDNDGGVDLLVVNRDAPATLLRNRVAERGNWVGFRVLEASGRDALGAVVRLALGERRLRREVRSGYSYLAANDPRVHVGLGSADAVEDVEVQWVDGSRESFGRAAAGAWRTLRRGEGQARP